MGRKGLGDAKHLTASEWVTRGFPEAELPWPGSTCLSGRLSSEAGGKPRTGLACGAGAAGGHLPAGALPKPGGDGWSRAGSAGREGPQTNVATTPPNSGPTPAPGISSDGCIAFKLSVQYFPRN